MNPNKAIPLGSDHIWNILLKSQVNKYILKIIFLQIIFKNMAKDDDDRTLKNVLYYLKYVRTLL